jgi:hypothetical protein
MRQPQENGDGAEPHEGLEADRAEHPFKNIGFRRLDLTLEIGPGRLDLMLEIGAGR